MKAVNFRQGGSEDEWRAGDDPMRGVFQSVLSDVKTASRQITERVQRALSGDEPHGPLDAPPLPPPPLC